MLQAVRDDRRERAESMSATDEHEVEPQRTERKHMPQERPRVELEAVADQAAEAEAEAVEVQAWQAWMRQLLHLEHLEVVEHRRSPQLHVVPVDACAAPRGC